MLKVIKFEELYEINGPNPGKQETTKRGLKGMPLTTENPSITDIDHLDSEDGEVDKLFSEDEVSIDVEEPNPTIDKPKKFPKKKNVKKFNEGLTDLMTPPTDDEINSTIENLTPYGMRWRINDLNLDLDSETFKKYEKIANDRIDKSLSELDDIFDQYITSDAKSGDLLNEMSKWVTKYGGNAENFNHGIKEFSEFVQSTFDHKSSHMWEQLYSYESVGLLNTLLKQLAKDETEFNNIDYGE